MCAVAQEVDEPFLFSNDENIPGGRVIEQFDDRIEFLHYDHPKKGDSDEYHEWFQAFNATVQSWRADPNRVIAATDGSLRQGCGVASFVIGHTVCAREVPASSSFDAETQALEDLFRHCAETGVEGTVTVLCDNESAAKAIFSTDSKDGQFVAIRAMAALRVWLTDNLARRLTISWCPSHSGVAENETADRLAGEHEPRLSDVTNRSRARTNQRIRSQAGEKWRGLWAARKTGKHLNDSRREVLPSTGSQRYRFVKKADNIVLFSRFTRLVMNHMPSGEYRQRFFRQEDPGCCFCRPARLPLTRAHIMCRCVRYISLFPSMYEVCEMRNNYLRIIKYLKRNPTAGTFGDAEGIG